MALLTGHLRFLLEMLLSLALLVEYFETSSLDSSVLTSLRYFCLVHIRRFCLEDAFILGRFCQVLFETLLSSFILRRFCRVLFWDTSGSEMLLSWIILRHFWLGDASILNYFETLLAQGCFHHLLYSFSSFSSLFFFFFFFFSSFFFFSLGSRCAPTFMRRAPYAYRHTPIVMWRTPLWLQLHIPSSFQILHSCLFIFFYFLPFSKHSSVPFPSKTPNLSHSSSCLDAQVL